MEKISEGLRHVSASPLTLSLILEDDVAVHLNQEETTRVLAEVAQSAPELLHAALERRLTRLIAAEVVHELWPGR